MRPSVHQFSDYTAAPESCDARDLPSGPSLDGLRIPEDMPLLMDQSVPPSPIRSPTRSQLPVLPFEEVVSRTRALKMQKYQVSPFTKGPGIISSWTQRSDTSTLRGSIADFRRGDICMCTGLFVPSTSLLGPSLELRLSTIPRAALSSRTSKALKVDMSTARTPIKSYSGPAALVSSFKDFAQDLPPLFDMHATLGSRSPLHLGTPSVPNPFNTPPVSSLNPGPSGHSICTKISPFFVKFRRLISFAAIVLSKFLCPPSGLKIHVVICVSYSPLRWSGPARLWLLHYHFLYVLHPT